MGNARMDESLWIDETEDYDYSEPPLEPNLRVTRSLFPIWENELIKKHRAVVRCSFPLLHALHQPTKDNIKGVNNINNNTELIMIPVAEVLRLSPRLMLACILHSTIRQLIYFQVYFLLLLAIQYL